MGILQFKKANCKNCYKCVRNCPVKAIRVIDQQAQIVEEDCILCGRCTVVCPQNAKEDISSLQEIRQLLASGNDAALAIADHCAGSTEKFAAMMNEKARNLGAANTFYMNPTGLSSAAYTTAYDTAKICAYAYENDLFMEISSKRAYTVPATNLHDAVTIYTRNSFLTPKSEYYYSYAEGICTGYAGN